MATTTQTLTHDDRIKIATVDAVTASEDEQMGKCAKLLHTILWGKEGTKHLNLKLTIVLGIEAIFLVTVVLDMMAGGHLKDHGIQPRHFPMGLVGIFFAPFLHKNIFHLLVNCVPFFVLSMLVLLRDSGISSYFLLTFVTIIGAGVLVWVTGSSKSNHIGSSSLIFSYFGYLVVSAFIRRSIRDFVIGVVVFLVYSSIFWGVLPVDEKVSWESHLFGLIVGVVFGFIDAKMAEYKQLAAKKEEDEEASKPLLK